MCARANALRALPCLARKAFTDGTSDNGTMTSRGEPLEALDATDEHRELAHDARRPPLCRRMDTGLIWLCCTRARGPAVAARAALDKGVCEVDGMPVRMIAAALLWPARLENAS